MTVLLKDKVAVITGSSRGFGYAIAEEMLKAGAVVVITGRKDDALQQAIKSLSTYGQVSGWLCDVSDEKQVYALARNIFEKYGRIDIWINNAGFSSAAGMVLDIPPQQAIDMFLANDMGTLYRDSGSSAFHASPPGGNAGQYIWRRFKWKGQFSHRIVRSLKSLGDILYAYSCSRD